MATNRQYRHPQLSVNSCVGTPIPDLGQQASVCAGGCDICGAHGVWACNHLALQTLKMGALNQTASAPHLVLRWSQTGLIRASIWSASSWAPDRQLDRPASGRRPRAVTRSRRALRRWSPPGNGTTRAQGNDYGPYDSGSGGFGGLHVVMMPGLSRPCLERLQPYPAS